MQMIRINIPIYILTISVAKTMINPKFDVAGLRVIALTIIVLSATAFAPYAHTEQLSKPNRIISAGGSITEIMYALGLGDRIVAVDSSSFYPPKATTLPKVGYFRSLAAEGVMSLKPDMLITARGAGPEIVLEQLESLGVEVKSYEQSNYTLDSWKTLIQEIGAEFDKSKAASELIDSVSKGISNHQEKRDFTNKSVNAVSLLSIGQRGPVAAGSNTVPDLLMSLAGINNVASSLDGYKPFSSELFAEREIDMLLVPSHVVAGLGGEEAICKNQLVKMATSEQCNLFVMDGLLLMGFGARLDQSVGEMISFANGL